MAKSSRARNRQIGPLSATDLRNMQLFRQIADAGGITAACDRFGVEKTAASRAVRALEQRLDGALCIRGPKGFALTEYGRQVYSSAAALDDALDRARMEIGHAQRTLEGEVRLGVTDNCLTNPNAKISDAIEQFMQIAPAVRISMAIFPADQLTLALRHREVHLGIVSADHAVNEHLSSEPIFIERTSLYCCPPEGEPPPHLERLSESGYGAVLRRFSHYGPGMMSRQIDAAWTVEASGIEAVATFVNTGRCVGILPDHYVRGTRTRRPFVVVPGAERLHTTAVFSIAFEKERLVSQAVSVLRECILDAAKTLGSQQEATMIAASLNLRPAS